MSDSQRSIPPTQRRIREARARGDVRRSRDLAAAASWAAVSVGLVAVLPRAAGELSALSAAAFGSVPTLAVVEPGEWARRALDVLLWLCAAPLLAGFACVLLAGLIFTGPLWSTKAVSPDLGRLGPSAGLKRVLSASRWIDSLRDTVKLAVLLALAAVALRASAPTLLAAPALSAVHAPSMLRQVVQDTILMLGCGVAAFAVVDAVWADHRWLARLRMTPQELKRELRETEGDPSLKGQRRRVHREIAEHRMMEEVRRATVVIVNPTHVAVALRWDEEVMDAPTVAARGRNAMARRIIQEARRAGVPVVHDVTLARTLVDLEPGQMIPERLYEAVAAIIRVIEDGSG